MGEFVVWDNEGIRRVHIAGQMMLGRSQHSDLVLNSAMASRRHAWVWPQGEQVIIEDLGSTNGTFVNDRLLRAPQYLHNRDVVVIGNTRLTFLADEAFVLPDTERTQPGSPLAWGTGQHSATPTSPVIARPFPQAQAAKRATPRIGRGAWILILLLAILTVVLLTLTGMLAVYTLT
jgi:predicted component of type VI protein secretion system